MCFECNIGDHVCFTVPWQEENLAPLYFSTSPSGAWRACNSILLDARSSKDYKLLIIVFLSLVTGARSPIKWGTSRMRLLSGSQTNKHRWIARDPWGPGALSSSCIMSMSVEQSPVVIHTFHKQCLLTTTEGKPDWNLLAA